MRKLQWRCKPIQTTIKKDQTMHKAKKTHSWIDIEPFNQDHSWKQTWIFIGGAMVLFLFALLYEIDKNIDCNDPKSTNMSVHSSVNQTMSESPRMNSD